MSRVGSNQNAVSWHEIIQAVRHEFSKDSSLLNGLSIQLINTTDFWLMVFCTTTSTHKLLHTITHCSTMQHTATRCNTLRHTTTHCNTLQSKFISELTVESFHQRYGARNDVLDSEWCAEWRARLRSQWPAHDFMHCCSASYSLQGQLRSERLADEFMHSE